MLLIPYVETIVGGSMSLWPQVILRFLFEYPQTTFSGNTLAAFFYGNGLMCSTALRLVSVCHCGPSEELLQRIHCSYDKWNKSPDDGYLSIYWNVRHRKFVWLHGAKWASTGKISEVLGGGYKDNPTVGFGYKPRAWLLRRRLYVLRRTVQH